MDDEGASNGSRPRLGPGDGGADLISALPDDLLLQVLERLGSDAAAARTTIISRRWRDLWTRLPKVTVTLDDLPFSSLEAALHRAAARPGLCHYLLDIRVPGQDDTISASSVSSLLRVAAGLSPVELRFTLPQNLKAYPNVLTNVQLPCFRRATAIELCGRDLRLGHATYGRWGDLLTRVPFHSLQRFSLSGCHLNLATFLPRCPRLRVLSLNAVDLVGMDTITIHSASLEELVVEHKNRWTDLCRISIEAPMLKHLTMSFHARPDLGVSILAPVVEKVSWRCSTARIPGRFMGSVFGASPSFPNAELNFEADIDEHVITNFSSLDLRLRTKGHVFGAFVLQLLGLQRIRTAIQNLKIVLLGPEVKDACRVNCLCDDPKYRRTKSISLPSLEEVEIEGVKGENHEFDFLKVIFRCAPMLKRMTVRLSDGVAPSPDWCTKINNIVKVYPVVECNIHLDPGSTNNSQSFAST
ncbi:unnamed protein product [Alopecurus aequalis]